MRCRIFFVRAPFVATGLLICACSASSTTPIAKHEVPASNYLRVADCEGPPSSLPSDLRARLGPRTGQMLPDDHWADLAERIPGGFAGVLYSDGKPVLMLTRPDQATAAKKALESDPAFNGFDVERADVRKARWDFGQLVDWYRYFVAHTSVWNTPGMASGDKNEATNRIRFGVETEAGRQELKRKLLVANVPCDLVEIGLQSRATF
jgi:hypothetical protein